MTSLENLIAGLFIVCWGWRIWCLVYSSYAVADAVTPKFTSGSSYLVAGALTLASVIVRMLPTSDVPALSLTSKLLSVPSEVYTLYFAHRYVGPAFNSRRVTVLLYALTLFSILENLYSLYSDFENLQ